MSLIAKVAEHAERRQRYTAGAKRAVRSQERSRIKRLAAEAVAAWEADRQAERQEMEYLYFLDSLADMERRRDEAEA